MSVPAPEVHRITDPATLGLAFDILVVDDDPKNLTAIEAALGGVDGRVVKACSGQQALRLLLENDFAVILLDVQMPGMNGFDTAQLIRSRRRNQAVPIIFVTAFNQNDTDIHRGYDLGAVDYLFKPIVPEILRAKVNAFVELRRRTELLVRQSERLRRFERIEADRRLQQERMRWRMNEQERVNRELELADRRKDEFIAILAHELRNPLAPLAASLEVMRSSVPVSAELLERLRGTMERQVRHLTRLVDDLLDVARIANGKILLDREPFDLGEAIDQAVERCGPLIENRRQQLEVENGANVPIVADRDRVAQVVSNLLTNASRYTPDGGRITIQLANDGSHGLVRVTDTGMGIPSEHLDRIFELFAQHTAGSGGLGLGLTLVKRLVELHGGSVEAQSDGVGRGSSFTVRIPIATSTRDASGPRDSAPPGTEPVGPRR